MKGNLFNLWKKEVESRNLLMVINTLESTWEVNLTAKGNMCGRMVNFMKESSKMASEMALGNGIILKKHITKDNLKGILSMDTEFRSSKMETNIRANMLKESEHWALLLKLKLERSWKFEFRIRMIKKRKGFPQRNIT